MIRGVVRKIRSNFALKFVLLFVTIIVVSIALTTHIFSRFIYRDIVNRVKLDLSASKKDFIASINDKRNLAFHYAQFVAATQNMYLYPRRNAEEFKSLEAFIIEKARLLDFEVDLITVYPGEELMDETLKKGLTGVVSSSLSMSGGLRKSFSVVAVSPVIEEGKVKKIVRVTYPVTRKFLLERKQLSGTDISVLYKGIVVASTSNCSECMLCFKRVIASPNYGKMLESTYDVYFEDNCDPYYHSGIITRIDIGEMEPLYIFVTREMKGEVVAFRKGAAAYVLGVFAYSAVMILVFVVFARKLTRPVKRLTAMARDISEGKPGITVEQTRIDEIGELEVSLNEMSRKLADAFSQIERRKKELESLNTELKNANMEILGWNKNLEERVREKTRELERVHEKMLEMEKIAAVWQLTAGVAHELDNPLDGIIGYVRFGLEKIEDVSRYGARDDDIEKLRSCLKMMDELAVRCRGIVKNLTGFSREITHDREQVDLNALVGATCVNFKKELEEKGIILSVDFAKDLRTIYGSSSGIGQVVWNLIVNARDAMPVGGDLNVKTHNNGENVVLDIIDTGKGIPRDSINKIFEPFFTTKEAGKGTGLGLYVSYNIIKEHGGDISVRSKEGKGTMVSISIPSALSRDKRAGYERGK